MLTAIRQALLTVFQPLGKLHERQQVPRREDGHTCLPLILRMRSIRPLPWNRKVASI